MLFGERDFNLRCIIKKIKIIVILKNFGPHKFFKISVFYNFLLKSLFFKVLKEI